MPLPQFSCPPRRAAGSYAVPVTVQLRRELDSHAILSGFVNDVSSEAALRSIAACPLPRVVSEELLKTLLFTSDAPRGVLSDANHPPTL